MKKLTVHSSQLDIPFKYSSNIPTGKRRDLYHSLNTNCELVNHFSPLGWVVANVGAYAFTCKENSPFTLSVKLALTLQLYDVSGSSPVTVTVVNGCPVMSILRARVPLSSESKAGLQEIVNEVTLKQSCFWMSHDN